MNFGGFSWRKFIGFSAAKARFSRQIGVPLSQTGRQRKLGAMMGCQTMAAFMLIMTCLFVYLLLWTF